jgi:TM2 domain-containing membrane protein YozV
VTNPAVAATTQRLPESRGLKLAGLLLMLAGAAVLVLAAERMAENWPLGLAQVAPHAVLGIVAANAFGAGLLTLAAGCGSARSWRHPGRRRAIALQVVLINLVAPALLVAVLLDDSPIGRELEASGWDIALAVAGYVLCFVAWRLWRRSQQHEAIDADEAMAADPRPPVLYLRSFCDDGVSILAQEGSALKRRLARTLSLPTPEEHMATILARVGPVIAIGKPGEPLPELGAGRLYVAHDQWQQRVTELMRSAALVVVRVGASPGVLWEIEQALANLPRQRLVLAVLGGQTIAPELVARLQPVLGASFADVLPQPVPGRDWRSLLWRQPSRRIGGLVCFSAEGQAVAVPVQLGLKGQWRSMIGLSLRPFFVPMQRAWEQVFARLDPAWRSRTEGTRSRAVAVLLALVFGYVGAQWFYLGNRRRGWTYVACMPLLMAPMFLSFGDALKFLWVDRTEFEARFVAARAR